MHHILTLTDENGQPIDGTYSLGGIERGIKLINLTFLKMGNLDPYTYGALSDTTPPTSYNTLPPGDTRARLFVNSMARNFSVIVPRESHVEASLREHRHRRTFSLNVTIGSYDAGEILVRHMSIKRVRVEEMRDCTNPIINAMYPGAVEYHFVAFFTRWFCVPPIFEGDDIPED